MDSASQTPIVLFTINEDQPLQDQLDRLFAGDHAYRVYSFSRAADALRLRGEALPDIFVINYDLSNMTGFQLYEQLQGQSDAVPCIFLNAPDSLNEEKPRLAWNLPVPWNTAELSSCLEQARHAAAAQFHR